MSTYSTTLNVSYGSDPLQFVNLYVPTGTPKGTILHIHGGAWSAVNGSVGPSSTSTDPNMIPFVTAGYAVIDMQYRDRGVGNGGGTYITGNSPGDVADVVTVLSHCLDSAVAASAGGSWPSVQSYIAANGGLFVGGSSAGGHLTIMGVCTYGTNSGKWPKGAISIAGPLNIDYFTTSTNYIDPYIRSIIVDDYIHTGLEADQKLASPLWQYGTQLGEGEAPTPGPWFSAVNASACKFIFVQNDNDTLVPLHTVAPCIVSFTTYNSTNTSVIRVLEGPPLGDWDGFSPITNKGSLSLTSQLPSSGQTLGDMYSLPNGTWVYNNGTYPGDAFYPASVNGFTLWFQHNYTTQEYPMLLDNANAVFGNITLSPTGTLTTGTTGVLYSQQITASGGTGPYTYTMAYVPSNLINGINLSSSGLLSGTTSVPGLYAFSIRATDVNGATVVGNYQLTITSAAPIKYNPKPFLQGQDAIFTGNRYPRGYWHNQYHMGIETQFSGDISNSTNANPDFSATQVYVVDEIWWGTGKPTGQDLQALCDYWRYHGISPGVGINHAAEGGYFGNTPVPTATILADAIRCDWIALDPYLFTASVPYFNSGNSAITQTSINTTIAGLVNWTQGWIDRLAPYGIPVVLITQGIRELSMPQNYVDQYLEVQYSTFGIQQTPLRLVFPYEVLLGLEVFTLVNVDVSGHVNAHPFAKTNQHFPNLTSARPAKGQLYPRNTFKY